jgi:phosphoglycerate kinase
MGDLISVDELDLSGKRVLIRVDYNVPLDEKGNVTDDTRIRRTLPTLECVINKGAKVILCSHLGRPKGAPEPRFSLRPCAQRLRELLGKEVVMAPDCVGPHVKALIERMKPGDIIMLENLRFHRGEAENDPSFARSLASLADVYVNDGFAVAHRSNASVDAITRYVAVCAAGLLMKAELEAFSKALRQPQRPLVGILGGGKVSDKVAAVSRMVSIADKVIIGGAISFTFLKAMGISAGDSPVEEELLPKARGIMQKARRRGVSFYLPVDFVIAQKASADASTQIKPAQEIPQGWAGLDVGDASIMLFREVISDAGTIVWNGPMGVYELEPFRKGTWEMLKAVAQSEAFSVLGGGDLDAAVHMANVQNDISYLSTGGGAFLELLEGRTLPGIKALERCARKRG